MTQRGPRAPRPVAARVDAKGRITLPLSIRRELGIVPGKRMLLRRDGEELRVIAADTLLSRMRAATRALRDRMAE